MSRETEKNEETKEFDPMTGNYRVENKPKRNIEDVVKKGEGEGGAFSNLDTFKKSKQETVYDAQTDESIPFEKIPFSGNEAKIILEKRGSTKNNENVLEVAKSIGVPAETIDEYSKEK